MKRRIGFLLPPGFQALDLMTTTVFEIANNMDAGPHYEMTLLSEKGGMQPQGLRSTRPFLDFLLEASRQSRRTASICTGAFILAEAGLLDGRRATTHWAMARDLQRAYPKTRVEEDRIFINDGRIWTSAGMTACIDLCLAMVESDLGRDASRHIARQMVVYHRRSGGQSQFSALLELEPKSDRIQQALSYAKRHLRKPLSVDELAEAANLSTRQFSRSFRLETGQSPARAVEVLRVEAARAMIESSNHPIDVVARETGFSDPERMRRAFLRAFGQPPQAIKRAAREQVTSMAR